MWFSLFAVVLILTMTFFQGLQGLFSALIACVLTILSAALAFGFYEDVYFSLLMQYLPEQGRAVALVGIFVVTLIVLRVVFDLLITGNMQFPGYVDRAGGGVIGLITSMIIVGMMAIGIQMLPFGPSFLGFSRYALVDDTGKALEPTGNDKEVREFRANLDWSKVVHRRRSLWLNPDGFTAGLVSTLSSNSLRGRQTLSSIYPDVPESVYNVRSVAFAASRTMVKPDALSLEGYWDMPPGAFYRRQLIKDEGGKRTVELKPLKEMEPDKKAVVVRVRINSDARDEDSNHRFSTRQCRLVGREGKDGPAAVSCVAGVNSEQFERWVQLADGESIVRTGGKDGTLRIDLVFLVPSRADYEPLFLEYKRNARVEIRPPDEKAKAKQGAVKPIAPEQPKEEKKEKKPKAQAEVDQKPQQDRISGLGPARKESVFKNELPFELTKYGGNADVNGGEFRGGRIVLTLDDEWKPKAGDQPAAKTFQVPPDKRLLQLSVEKLQPGSWLGSIYGGVIDNISDFYLIDANGEKHMPWGHYAMAMVGEKPTFELLYLDESQRSFGRLPKFEKVKARDLKGDYALFYLFAVPPGCKPVKLHTGRTDVDLKNLDLTAPQ